MEENMRIKLIRKSAFAAAASLCMFITLACLGQQAQAAEPQYGGTLTIGTETEPRGFDPIEAGYISTRARSHIAAVVERLFDMDDEG
jgi:4-phytase/acid phosphatase/peptide/nickel transport system substrate-binding protein